MDLMEAIRQRHSVRRYEKKSIDSDTLTELEKIITECNEESGLNIQLVKNEPKAFDSAMAHYGKFSGVTNYIAMIGKKARIWMNNVAIMERRLFLRRNGWD